MILYQLICDQGHKHESWFRDSAAFDALSQAGTVICPVCGSSHVSKAPMAPRVLRHTGGQDAVKTAAADGSSADITPTAHTGPNRARNEVARGVARDMVERIRKHIEKTCDYVGDQFTEEARRIHYGERDARGIYGEATQEDAQALRDEGVDVVALPQRRTLS